MQRAAFDTDRFLADTWQKQPLLIRGAFPGWTNPLDPDELAGLACEKEIESRIIVRTRKTWKVRHGPFKPKRFARLGKKPWTLLVQAVDHHVPAVAALLDAFRFIPNWRIDDVMVSYASDGGGVGPHFDQYDVFLVQGLGQRRWRVGARCDATTTLRPHDDLRLLAAFDARDEWILDPGDMLYLPPGIAHDGVAVGDDCMTYSIGFRAPSRAELIAHYCDHLLDGLSEGDRYADPDLPAQANPGEIGAQALDALHAMVTDRLLDRAAFARWFGQFTTTPKTAEAADHAIASMPVDSGAVLIRNPTSRFSFVDTPPMLFVDGRCFDCDTDGFAFAQRLCAATRIEIGPDAASSVRTVIAALLEQGSLVIDTPD